MIRPKSTRPQENCGRGAPTPSALLNVRLSDASLLGKQVFVVMFREPAHNVQPSILGIR